VQNAGNLSDCTLPVIMRSTYWARSSHFLW